MANLSSVARTSLDNALGRSGEEVSTKINNAIQGASGYTAVIGSAVLVSADNVVITTGLTSVNAFFVSLASAVAPTVIQMTYAISGGTVTVYFWKATAAGDTALIAASGNWSISYLALGA